MVFDELDAEALGSDGDFDLLDEFFEVLALLDLLLEFLFQLLQLFLVRVGNGCGAISSSRHGGAEQSRSSLGIVEVSGDSFLDFFAGAHEPEDDEERHHGGNEVGVGHLPCAAMVAAVTDDFLDDDDGLRFGWHALPYAAAGLAASAGSVLFLQLFSISSKLGRA